jgi:hypothetical protein
MLERCSEWGDQNHGGAQKGWMPVYLSESSWFEGWSRKERTAACSLFGLKEGLPPLA